MGFSKTIWKRNKETKRKEIIPLLLISSLAVMAISHFQCHYSFLHFLDPEFFDYERIVSIHVYLCNIHFSFY
ncbi:MAG: hypothetical protein CME65_08230 [Halobacteriovoraceae bacterium]|nr:hypothetical protein [Halobacteriovoraceae bacterium]